MGMGVGVSLGRHSLGVCFLSPGSTPAFLGSVLQGKGGAGKLGETVRAEICSAALG